MKEPVPQGTPSHAEPRRFAACEPGVGFKGDEVGSDSDTRGNMIAVSARCPSRAARSALYIVFIAPPLVGTLAVSHSAGPTRTDHSN
jgi:hypothetical protein